MTRQPDATQIVDNNADTDSNVDHNATTLTMGNNADNDNALQHRQWGDGTTIRKRSVVALMRARAVAVALATAVVVAVARLVVWQQ